MTIREMQDNIIGKYGLEAKETVLFFQLCEKLSEDNKVNNAILKLCHNSLLGIKDYKRVQETQEKEAKENEDLMKKAVNRMIDKDLNNDN